MSDLIISAAGLRIIKLLVGNPAQTVSDLIRATGVTRTAVTEQLSELVAAGFVARDTQRLPGRGRPRHLYKATDAALALLFVGNQRLVVPAIWQAIAEFGGDEMVQQILHRVSHALAQHYRERITATSPDDRLRQLIALMEEEGGLVDVLESKDGQLVMKKRSCAFFSMFDEHRSVCHIDIEMLSDVVGCRVRQTTCRHDGAPCCTFEIVRS